MKQSKMKSFKIQFTGYANQKELYYRNKLSMKDKRTNSITKWTAKRHDGRLKYIPKLKDIGAMPYGRVIELGAGSCWFTSEISKEDSVKEIYSVEFSRFLLTKIAPIIMKESRAHINKITRVLGDFNKLEFKDKLFDCVVFDAAMHHATNLNVLLKEATRVLKKGGLLIAIREPVIPLLRPCSKFKFGKEDKGYGITENIYTLSEWKAYFNNAGLKFKAVPFIPPISFTRVLLNICLFNIFNRLFLGHYIFISKKN